MVSPLFPFIFGSKYLYHDGIDHAYFDLPNSFTGGDAIELIRWLSEVLDIEATREDNKIVLNDANYLKLMNLYRNDKRTRRLMH